MQKGRHKIESFHRLFDRLDHTLSLSQGYLLHMDNQQTMFVDISKGVPKANVINHFIFNVNSMSIHEDKLGIGYVVGFRQNALSPFQVHIASSHPQFFYGAYYTAMTVEHFHRTPDRCLQ